MLNPTRLKNKIIARIITRFPSLSQRLIDSYSPWESEDIPWAPVVKPIHSSRVAIVTTAGVHLKNQVPFDMHDHHGDPTYRMIDRDRPLSELMITHDYYDHSDADKDINVVFPLQRLEELEQEKHIGAVAQTHYSFMGHIDGPHISTLVARTAPETAHRLKADGTDAVLLTPG